MAQQLNLPDMNLPADLLEDVANAPKKKTKKKKDKTRRTSSPTKEPVTEQTNRDRSSTSEEPTVAPDIDRHVSQAPTNGMMKFLTEHTYCALRCFLLFLMGISTT